VRSRNCDSWLERRRKRGRSYHAPPCAFTSGVPNGVAVAAASSANVLLWHAATHVPRCGASGSELPTRTHTHKFICLPTRKQHTRELQPACRTRITAFCGLMQVNCSCERKRTTPFPPAYITTTNSHHTHNFKCAADVVERRSMSK